MGHPRIPRACRTCGGEVPPRKDGPGFYFWCSRACWDKRPIKNRSPSHPCRRCGEPVWGRDRYCTACRNLPSVRRPDKFSKTRKWAVCMICGAPNEGNLYKVCSERCQAEKEHWKQAQDLKPNGLKCRTCGADLFGKKTAFCGEDCEPATVKRKENFIQRNSEVLECRRELLEAWEAQRGCSEAGAAAQVSKPSAGLK